MIEFILLFIPECVAMLIHCWMQKKKYENKEYLTIYGGYVGIINFILFSILYLVKDDFFRYSDNFDKPSFVFKFLILAFILSIVLPFIVCIFSKNFTLKADFVKKNEKNKKRR